MDPVDEYENGYPMMELVIDENGVAHEVHKVEVCFIDESEMEAFREWLKTKGEEFHSWYEGMKRLRGTICEKCNWKDPTQIQCLDGHMQGIGPCEGFMEEDNDEYSGAD